MQGEDDEAGNGFEERILLSRIILKILRCVY
jgi:hypothetical protein